MSSALIITTSEKNGQNLTDLLKQRRYNEILTAEKGKDARELILARAFDLLVVEIPLADESGQELAIMAAVKSVTCQVIVLCETDFPREAVEMMKEYGIFSMTKPLDQEVFYSALDMMDAVCVRMGRFRRENTKLQKKIEDIRLVNRAKMTLMGHLNMSEPEAHRYIEKQAMDLQVTRREVSEKILKTYIN